jgi:hypothetical protein
LVGVLLRDVFADGVSLGWTFVLAVAVGFVIFCGALLTATCPESTKNIKSTASPFL